jgi:hypothetical protein
MIGGAQGQHRQLQGAQAPVRGGRPAAQCDGQGAEEPAARAAQGAVRRGKSWSNNYFYNASTGNPATMSTLTLSNLGAHTHVSIDMMLGFLNSWDSSNGSPAPDYLDIYIDGNLAYKLTTVTAGGNVNDHGGGTQVVDNGQIDGSQFYSDDLVDMSTASFLSFAHTSSTLTLSFQASGAGWQGGTDEFWGVDSLSISTRGGGNPVPEPATWALVMIAGLAAAATRRQGAR